MWNGMSCKYLWIIGITIVFLSGMSKSSITLEEFQGRSLTQCKSGLVAGRDTLHFTSHIPGTNVQAEYQILTKGNNFFTNLCFFNVQKGTKLLNGTSPCTVITNGNTTVDIRFKANASQSEALIRGRWHLGNVITESEIRSLPKIYDPNQSGITLEVNGQNPDPSRCVMTLTMPYLSILFRCNETNPLPCALKIEDHYNNVTLSNGNGALSFCDVVEKKSTLSFSYKYCHSQSEHTFECIFEREHEHSKLYGAKRHTNKGVATSRNSVIFTIVVVLLVSSLIANFILLICIMKRNIQRKILEIYLGIKMYIISKSTTYQNAIEGLTVCQSQSIDNNQSLKNQPFISLCDYFSMHEDVKDTYRIVESSASSEYGYEKLIQIVAMLTVKVDISKVSAERASSVWPETNIPYHLSSEKLPPSIPRCGSGRIWRVVKYEDGADEQGNSNPIFNHCQCLQCTQSGRPNSIWGRIQIYTSASLVFDDIEAKSASFNVSFHGKHQVLRDVYVERIDLQKDYCSIIAATCDMDLVDTLKVLLEKFNNTCTKIYSKPSVLKSMFGRVFIVFYPQGETKKVSRGQLVRIENNDMLGTRLVYDAHTCPGSLGAPVIVIGYNDRWTSGETHFIHCGSTETYSCSGFTQIN